ncbi:MAG: helix-hairpin-helix domain-containing protein [Gammaproteobacteria bacterium]
MFEQGVRLAASPLHKAIILEGRAHDLAGSGMRREALQGALISLRLFLGIPLLRSVDAEESVRLMLYAARQFDHITRQVPPRLFKGKRPKGKRKTQMRILQSLPGIGPGTAHNLLEQFGSIEAVLAADEQALLKGCGQAPGGRNPSAGQLVNNWRVTATKTILDRWAKP